MFRECKYFVKFIGQRLRLKKQKIFSFATLNTVSSRKPFDRKLLEEAALRLLEFKISTHSFPFTLPIRQNAVTALKAQVEGVKSL